MNLSSILHPPPLESSTVEVSQPVLELIVFVTRVRICLVFMWMWDMDFDMKKTVPMYFDVIIRVYT